MPRINTDQPASGKPLLLYVPSIEANSWWGVTWAPSPGPDLLVAVAAYGTGGRVMTSPDGITWTSRSAATNAPWYAITWASELDLLVAVAASGAVMTSPDGIAWTARTAAANNRWRSIVWAPEIGDGLLVAVAETGDTSRVMTSPDGITWTAREAAVNNDWRSVTWAPELGLLVAVAATGTGNRVMTSPDGITWTARTSAADNEWFSVTWAPAPGPGLLVAVASSGTGNRVMTSPDGINWTTRVSAVDNAWRSVVWAPGLSLFVAVSLTGIGNRVMTSSDGVTWSTQVSAADDWWRTITWASELGLLVAVAENGSQKRVMTSSDGITWTSRDSALRFSGFVDTDWTTIAEANDFSIPATGEEGAVVDPNDPDRELRPGQLFFETPLQVFNNSGTTRWVELQITLEGTNGQAIPASPRTSVPANDSVFLPIQGLRLLKTATSGIQPGGQLQVRAEVNDAITVIGAAVELEAEDHAPDTEAI